MPVTKKGIGMLVVVSRGLRDGVRGRTLKSAELHHDGVNVHHSRLSICEEDAWDGR